MWGLIYLQQQLPIIYPSMCFYLLPLFLSSVNPFESLAARLGHLGFVSRLWQQSLLERRYYTTF